MIEHGMILGGLVVPETDRVIRDSDAWWKLGDWGCKPRGAVVPDLHIGHWTAGEAGTRHTDDDGPWIVRVMRNRPSKKIPGAKMQVSIDFVIGAGGDIWQTADPLVTACIGVGEPRVNRRAIQTEIVNVGTDPVILPRRRPTVMRRMLPTPKLPRGRKVFQRAYYPEQLEAWVWLCEVLHQHVGIPRNVPAGAGGGLEIDRFTREEMRRYRGAMEHFHVPSTMKLDGGTQLIGALLTRGWPTVAP